MQHTMVTSNWFQIELVGRGIFATNPDPVIVLLERRGPRDEWIKKGQTESVKRTLKAAFEQKILLVCTHSSNSLLALTSRT